VANGRGGVVDEYRFDEVVRVVGQLAVPPPLGASVRIAEPNTSRTAVGDSGRATRPDDESGAVLEGLRKLGQLRDAGVLTEEEFAAKKAELLERM
jgi:hypothetical protein